MSGIVLNPDIVLRNASGHMAPAKGQPKGNLSKALEELQKPVRAGLVSAAWNAVYLSLLHLYHTHNIIGLWVEGGRGSREELEIFERALARVLDMALESAAGELPLSALQQSQLKSHLPYAAFFYGLFCLAKGEPPKAASAFSDAESFSLWGVSAGRAASLLREKRTAEAEQMFGTKMTLVRSLYQSTPPPPPSDDLEKAAQYRTQAEDAATRQDYIAALDFFTRARALDPHHFEPQKYATVLQLGYGWVNAAKSAAEKLKRAAKLLEIKEDEVPAHLLAARSCLDKDVRQARRAQSYLERARQLPHSKKQGQEIAYLWVVFLDQLARIERNDQHCASALELLETFAPDHPFYQPALPLQLSLYEKTGRSSAGLAFVAQARPHLSPYLYSRSKALFLAMEAKEKEPEEAVPLLEQAYEDILEAQRLMAADPSSSEAGFGCGALYQRISGALITAREERSKQRAAATTPPPPVPPPVPTPPPAPPVTPPPATTTGTTAAEAAELAAERERLDALAKTLAEATAILQRKEAALNEAFETLKQKELVLRMIEEKLRTQEATLAEREKKLATGGRRQVAFEKVLGTSHDYKEIGTEVKRILTEITKNALDEAQVRLEQFMAAAPQGRGLVAQALSILFRRIDQLQQTLAKPDSAREELEKEVSRLREEVGRLKTLAETLKGQISALENERDALARTNETLKARILELTRTKPLSAIDFESAWQLISQRRTDELNAALADLITAPPQTAGRPLSSEEILCRRKRAVEIGVNAYLEGQTDLQPEIYRQAPDLYPLLFRWNRTFPEQINSIVKWSQAVQGVMQKGTL